MAVIVCPTRELCEQVEWQIYRLAMHIPGLRIVGLQGALKNVDAQIKAIQKGVDILVSTPGRLIALSKPRLSAEKKAQLEADIEKAKEKGKRMVFVDENRAYEEIDVGEEEDDAVEHDVEDDMDEFDEDEADFDDEFDGKADDPRQKSRRELAAKIASIDMNPEKTDRAEQKQRRKTIEPPTAKRHIIDLSHVRHFVLDEVDRMFAMGNFAEVKCVAAVTPTTQQDQSNA